MNYGGDAADQIVRYSLEGTEVALKLTGEAAKNFAVFAAAVLKDQRKIRGKTNLTRLLRENKPLRFFEVPESRMKEFAREANVRGLLYVPVRDRAKAAGKIEFAVWAEDAAKVNRVLEKMGVDYLQADTGAKAEVGPMPAAEQQVEVQTEVEEGIGMQVAQGNDSDSFACSCGSILGAYFADGLPEHWYAQFNNTIHTTMGNFHETDLQALTKRMQLLYKRVRQPEAPLA